MIDFHNAAFVKLRPADFSAFSGLLEPMLVEGEEIVATYKGMRDGVVFTNKRIISVNVQGITGKKKDITSLPYSKIQVFSIETAGVLDLDSELDLWFAGLGKVRFEFAARADVAHLARIIGEYTFRC